MKILPNHSLLTRNTFALDVRTVFYIQVDSIEDAVLLSTDEYFRTLPFLAVGAGSKLLFVGDFKGAVLHYTGSQVRTLSEDAKTRTIGVGAAKKWEDLVLETAGEGLWGLENLALIPGEVGGSTVQNVGAYGAEIKDVLVAVTYVDLIDGTIHRITNEECHFGYRHSIFKEKEMESALICEVELCLSKEAAPNLHYKGLQDLEGRADLTPLEVANKVIELRRAKLPYPSEIPNAGSFFLNPVITPEHFADLHEKYPDMPHYDTVDLEGKAGVKVPAAWLIEQCGMKGYTQGKVGTYAHQPLVIVNHGGASSRDIVELSEHIQKSVHDRFGISLHPEVHFIRSVEYHSVEEMIDSRS